MQKTRCLYASRPGPRESPPAWRRFPWTWRLSKIGMSAPRSGCPGARTIKSPPLRAQPCPGWLPQFLAKRLPPEGAAGGVRHRVAKDAAKSSGASLHGVFPGCECLPAGFQRTSQDGLKVRADCLTITARQYANTVRFLGLDGGDFGGADYGGNG